MDIARRSIAAALTLTAAITASPSFAVSTDGPELTAPPAACVAVREYVFAKDPRFKPRVPVAADQSPDCVLRAGHKGLPVETLQTHLNHCNSATLTTDGAYGPKTAAAVTAVQKGSKLTPDGAYGPLTRNVMKFYASVPLPNNGTESRCLAFSDLKPA